jgi:hypothetical protein
MEPELTLIDGCAVGVAVQHVIVDMAGFRSIIDLVMAIIQFSWTNICTKSYSGRVSKWLVASSTVASW